MKPRATRLFWTIKNARKAGAGNYAPPTSRLSSPVWSEWARLRLYKVHCRTFAVAGALCGVEFAQNKGLASELGQDAGGLYNLRVLPQYRTDQGKHLRTVVACEIRAQRRAQRQT